MQYADNAQDSLGTYIKAVPCLHTQEKISKFASLLNITNGVAKRDLHATVVASRVGIAANSTLLSSPITANPAGFTIFEGSTERCLVILLHSVDLIALHQAYRLNGASHNFPEYQPHITLSYDYVGDAPDDELIDQLPEFRFDLLHVEPFQYE
jgi:2'-5' RNA ligase